MKNILQPNTNTAGERDRLIEEHKPIVYHLAKKISLSLSAKSDIEDLVAYGQIGLIEAAERFDSSQGNKFSTFAYYRINGAIYDGLREMGVITRSRTHRFAANANDFLTTEADDSGANANRISSTATSAEEEIKTVESAIDALIPIYFLSIDDENAKEIRDDKALTNLDYETRDVLEKIRESLEDIKEEEAELLRKIYFKKILMKDIATQMGINKSWVSRLHARAIRHLQDVLRKKGILEPD